MSERNVKKNLESVDAEAVKEYLLSQRSLIKELKDKALILAGEYNGNLHIEIDANPSQSSVKLSVKEYF